jgi:hypothetical protein
MGHDKLHASEHTNGTDDIQDATNSQKGLATAAQIAALEAAGDVSKVGTPVDNQIAIWTGDGTIEGSDNITDNGTDVAINPSGFVNIGRDGNTIIEITNAASKKAFLINAGAISFNDDYEDLNFAVRKNASDSAVIYDAGNDAWTLNGTISGDAIKDEDDMSSDSNTHLASQQSIKAYADTKLSKAVNVNQATHGFAVGDTIYNDGGTWTKSQSDNQDTLTQGVVSEVSDASNFSIVFVGPVTYAAPHGYTIGDYLFTDASTAGLLTETEPTGLTQFSNPVAVVLDANTIFVLPWRPQNAIPRSNDLKIVSTSTDHVVADTDEFILCDATGGAIVVTLPTPSADYDGFTVKVKKVDSSANTVTIKTATGYNIDGVDGATGQVLTLQYEVISASCDAANYHLG